MSYEIMKRIRVVDGKVLLTGAANNVSPKTYEEWESQSLTKILKEQGKEALELEIFKQFENGNFQRGVSKYLRALKVLRNLPEYERFNWRTERGDEKRALRDSKEFDDLLLKALKTKLPKERFVVAKDYFGTKVYLHKLTRRCAKWTQEQARARRFEFKAEADAVKTYFTGAENWATEQVK